MSTFSSQQSSEQARVEALIRKAEVSVSFDFYPPRTEKAAERLYRSIEELVPLRPSFVTVGYGTGPVTRALTHELVLRIRRMTGLTVVPHLTCLGCSKSEIEQLVGTYYEEGIRNILALRGERSGANAKARSFSEADSKHKRDFPHAVDLVRFIKREFPEISVGAGCHCEGHRETPNRLLEMEYLRAKVDAGVDWLVTQLFFDNREFYDFQARCRMAGIEVPILAGIMPIVSKKDMHRIADLSPATRFPGQLLKAVDRVSSDAMVRNVGTTWATGQVFDLIENQVDGIHLFTRNRSRAALEIYRGLGMSEAEDTGAGASGEQSSSS